MEVVNFVLPAINGDNKNTTCDQLNKNEKDNIVKDTILKFPNTIVGHVKVDKNSKTISSNSKDVLKNLVDSLIGSDNSKNRMRANMVREKERQRVRDACVNRYRLASVEAEADVSADKLVLKGNNQDDILDNQSAIPVPNAAQRRRAALPATPQLNGIMWNGWSTNR